MRLINADKLKRKAQKVATESWKMKLTAKIETTLNQFIDWIDEAETIDAVPVIRCKDCKFFSDATAFTGKCDLRGDYIFTNDFCSYAVERRTDE